MKAVDIVENGVLCIQYKHGERFDTYVIKGEKDSGEICIMEPQQDLFK
jgi:aspartate 1-decarboxylase